MGMQSLRLKLRKRKYKLSLNGARRGGVGASGEGPTAFSNAGSEWEFENFSPWIFTANVRSSDENQHRITHEEADEEDEKYWGPRPRVQGLVNIGHNPHRQHHPTLNEEHESSSRYGILSHFPRRPSSWSPTSPDRPAPPVPAHAWQMRRRLQHQNSIAPKKNLSTSGSHTDLKRSASCAAQEARDATMMHRTSYSELPLSSSSSWGSRGSQTPVRLKRVQSELRSDQHIIHQRPLKAPTEMPIYSRPQRWRSTNEVRPGRSGSISTRPLHNGLKSTLATSESHLSGSYTLLTDNDPINRSPVLPTPPPLVCHRSALIERCEDEDNDGNPPPIPPHAPGVLCTRIVHLPASINGLANKEASALPQRGEKQSIFGSSSNGKSFTDGPRDGARDRRSGTGSGSDSFGEADRRAGYTPPSFDEEPDSSSSASAINKAKKVSRSESLRERAQRKHREKRKHSDPNLPPSHSSDMDREDPSLSQNNSGSSSNSSLSTSLESPSDRTISGGLSDGSSGLLSVATGSSGGVLTPWDSDLEADPDPPDWTRNLEAELLVKMTAKEKQRQEVINELFHTERSHVRNLKVLERIFYRPLLDNGFSDLVNLLFPNLPEMLEIHGRFNTMMKARKRDQPVVEFVGDILNAMFDGSSGETFQQVAATFCKYQSVALDSLRDRRKKDSKLQVFLAEAEGNPVCRRLQLKDIIPTAMQRLTKYPLLLESLAKYTQPRSDEMATVRKCLDRSREILNKVNQAIKEADNYNRLVDIQRRLDKSAFERSDHPIANEFKNFELTKHKLIYEGALTLRKQGQKDVVLHVVLLEECILLLQKQDDKYVLKFVHNTNSPIIKISNALVRPVATDRNALYLVNTSASGAQMYDLLAASIAERKAWFRHITDATEAYKSRGEGRNRRPDGSGSGSSSTGGIPPSFTTSSSSSQLLPTSEQQDKSKDEEPVEDNVSADSGVGLTPLTGDTQMPQAEPTSTSTDQQQQPSQQSANSLEAAQAEAAKKAGESAPAPATSVGAGGTTTPGSGTASPAPQRRLQRVEILKIAEGTPLIDPTEVVVSQGAVLTAEPVLTPLEKLRRKDQMIRTALAEKQRLVADILHVPHAELDPGSELLSESEGEKEARMLVMTAIAQATQLTSVLNDSLRITEEEAIAAVSQDPSTAAPAAVSSPSSPRTARRINRMPGAPTTKLLAITSALNKDLTQLLNIVTYRDEERDQLRRELQKTRDQLTELLVVQSAGAASSHLRPPNASRPVSHVSLSDCEATNESEQSEDAPSSPVSVAQALDDTGDVELLVYKSEGVHVELAGSLQNEECSSSINDNKVGDERTVGNIVIRENTALEVSESSEA